MCFKDSFGRCSSVAGSASDQPDDSDDFDSDAGPVSYTTEDGLLGIGRNANGLLSQLYQLNLLCFAMCLEPRRVAPGPEGGRVPIEHTSFLSFGESYTSQATSTVWTASIIPWAAKP